MISLEIKKTTGEGFSRVSPLCERVETIFHSGFFPSSAHPGLVFVFHSDFLSKTQFLQNLLMNHIFFQEMETTFDFWLTQQRCEIPFKWE